MRNVLRLLRGDKRNPSEVLDFSEVGGKIRLAPGFSPGPGEQRVIWSGSSLRRDGQDRIASSYDNAEVTLTYSMLEAGSTAELSWLQDEVARFLHEAGLYEERRQGEPVWIEYRWLDGLEDLPAPAFGQLSRYLRVLQGVQRWPDNVHNWLRGGAIEGVVATLICKPFAEGLEQRAGSGIGQLELDRKGVLVPYAVTNLVTNPSFGNADWDYGWTVNDAELLVYNETRKDFNWSLASAAHLINQNKSTARRFTQTLTLTSATYRISARVRTADGSDPASLFEFYGQGAALGTPTTAAIDGGPWYHCTSGFEGLASSSTHGIQVAGGAEVWVDDVQIALEGSRPFQPFCAGYLIGCSWGGTEHASSSSRGQPMLVWTLDEEMAGEFCVAGWLVPAFPADGVTVDSCVLEYWQDTYDQFRLLYDQPYDRFHLTGWRNNNLINTIGGTEQRSFSRFEPIHLAVVHKDGALILYVNGEQDGAANNIGLGFPGGGTLALGCSTQWGEAIGGWLDGWRIWREGLSAAEVASLYASELPIKEAYGSVGPPLFWWTKDGDDEIDAVDGEVSGSDEDNWGILGGIGGRVAAEVALHIDLPTSDTPRVVYAGIHATDEIFSPDDTLFHEYSGTADSGNSSGDAYEAGTTTGSGSDTHDFDSAADEIKQMRGIFQVLGRFRASGADIDAQPYFRLGASTRVMGDTQRIATSANMQLVDFGEMEIGWPDEQVVPAALTVGLWLTETEATVTTLWLDFLQLLPRPLCRVECEAASISIASGDTMVIVGRQAYLLDASSNDRQLYHFYHEGDELVAEPGKYNYVFFLLGEEDEEYDVTLAATVVVYVTPRWTLAGGAVA